ncbi:restriction endonuclease subunit S [Deinococcus sp. VB343]|uniref:restriction endonuclease subunit S n=1 Tax=Deinococcus sp. VB343 TaxID=3385567 RepID=UPI0039C9DEF8
MAEVSLNKVQNQSQKRFDPEYFNSVALLAAKKLEGAKTLGDFVKDGYRVVYENTEAIEFDGESSLPYFLQSSDISTPFISRENMIRVSESDWLRYPKGRIKAGELLIEVKGKAEKIAIVPDDFPEKTLVTGTCYKMTTIRDSDKYLIATFLLSKYGIALKNRLKTNLLVSYIAKDDLYSLPIPVVSDQFLNELKRLYTSSEDMRHQAHKLLQQAETLLLSALGLEQWQPPEALTYERSAKEVFEAGRLDAEHFKPKFYAVWEEAKLATGIETIRLGDMIEPVKNGFDFRNFSEDGTPYIRVGDVKNLRIDTEGAAKVAISQGDFSKDIQLREGDILFTRKGSFGNAAVVRAGQQHCIISSEIMLVRLKVEYSENILPDYLSIFLESKLGKLQSEQWAHGVAFYSISQADFENYRIPLLDLSKQVELMDKVVKSQSAQNQSLQLLEMAKRAVEMAIEESEAAALTYLAAHAPALA